jgi:hypothetical protein
MTGGFREMILDLTEDDYTGLWELLWRAQTIRPWNETTLLISELRSELQTLVSLGKLAFFEGNTFTGEENPVESAEGIQYLSVAAGWNPPPAGTRHLRVRVK